MSNILNSILNNNNLGKWEWNLSNNTANYSDKWLEITGLKATDIANTINDFESIIHPDDCATILKIKDDFLNRKRDNFNCEFRLQLKDEEIKWVVNTGILICNDDTNQSIIAIGTFKDITKEQTNQELLENYKDLIQRTNKVAKIGTWEVLIPSYKTTWSTVTKKIHEVALNYEPTTEEGIQFYREGDSRDRISSLFFGAIEHNKSFDDEFQIVTAKGNIKWVRSIGIPVFKNGKCIKVYGIFQDINEQTSLIKNLKLKEEQIRKTFEYSPHGVALVSLEGKWLDINNKIHEMLGYTKNELLKLTFQDITHPEDLETDLNLLKKTLKGEISSYTLEKRYIHKNGDIIWGNLSVSLVKDNQGKDIHFVSQIQDITQQKNTQNKINQLHEVTKNQNERLKNFAHIVSHNLRSHASNFNSLTDLLANKEEDSDVLINLYQIASKQLNETVKNLSEVVEMTSATEDSLEEINLLSTVKGAIANVQALLQEANGSINLKIDEDLNILGIKAYADSIVLNLLTNAIKYRYPDRKLIIEIKANVESDDKIKLCISDNGLGIDLTKHKNKIFGIYQTFHSHKDSKGIGLFITKNQIETMGGEIYVNSIVEMGTKFSIIFLKKDH